MSGGLYKKFDVDPSTWALANAISITPLKIGRVDGTTDHAECEYFVLDLNHDPNAPAVLRAYATVCGKRNPKMSQDLMKLANAVTVHQLKVGIR